VKWHHAAIPTNEDDKDMMQDIKTMFLEIMKVLFTKVNGDGVWKGKKEADEPHKMVSDMQVCCWTQDVLTSNHSPESEGWMTKLKQATCILCGWKLRLSSPCQNPLPELQGML